MKSCLKIFSSIGLVIFILIFQFEIIEGSEKSKYSADLNNDYNIVIICITTLRADHLSCYGYDRQTSPNIDKMAKESIVFENNFTPNSLTLTSVASIVTSLYPGSHGVFYIMEGKLPFRIKTLAEVLKIYGYETAWFGPANNSHLSPTIGFGRGFDMIGEFSPLGFNAGRMILFDWIEKNQNKNFFINCHIYKIHDPYLPPLKYKRRFTKQERKEIIEDWLELETATFNAIKNGLLQKKGAVWKRLGEESFKSELISGGLFEGNFTFEKFHEIIEFLKYKKELYKWGAIKKDVYESNINCKDVEIMKYLKSLYDAEILECDAKFIGPFIEKLKKLNLYDKTIIIICGDHGQEFAEHGKYGHGQTLYDEVTHVPFIVKIPWLKQGKRIQELTQTVDIMPTVLDLVGIPIPYHVQGKSLLNFIVKNNTVPIRKYVFGQYHSVSSIRSKEWKFILYKDGKRELFHLHSDPGEQRNLYTERQDIASKLESDLKKWEESLPSYIDKEYPFSPEVDEATQKRIKETGYW